MSDSDEDDHNGGRRGKYTQTTSIETPLERYGDFSEVRRIIASGRREYRGLFTDRDRMALAMSSIIMVKTSPTFRRILWQRYLYQRQLSNRLEVNGKCKAGTWVYAIKGKRKGRFGIVSGYDIVTQKYVVRWTCDANSKNAGAYFGRWAFLSRDRKAKRTFLRIVMWGGIDTKAYLDSFHPTESEKEWKHNESRWRLERKKRESIQRRFVQAGGPIDVPDCNLRTGMETLVNGRVQCGIFRSLPLNVGDPISVLRLLRWGCDPNAHVEYAVSERPQGLSPLRIASGQGCVDCFKLLILFGADATYCNQSY